MSLCRLRSKDATQTSSVAESSASVSRDAALQPSPIISAEELQQRQKTLSQQQLKVIVDEVKSLRNMNDIETHKNLFVTVIHESATLRETVQFMSDRKVGSIFVVDDEHHIKGFLTEKDLLQGTFAMNGKETVVTEDDTEEEAGIDDIWDLALVVDIMKPIEEIAITDSSTTVIEAVNIMSEKGIRYLPILA